MRDVLFVLVFISTATLIGLLLKVSSRPAEDVSTSTTASNANTPAASSERAPVEALPPAAVGVPVDPAKGYFVEEVRDGLYWVTDGTYTTMFLTTGQGVIAVDAPPSLGENYLRAIAEVTDEPVTHVIYSHSHADHIGAANMFPADAAYIAHEDTLDQLRFAYSDERPIPWGTFVGGSPVPLPTLTFAKDFILAVGNQRLELSEKGTNHEPGNLFIYAPLQKTLLLIDVIFPGWSPFANFALAENIPGFFRAHNQILDYDFDTLVAGHLSRLGTRQDVTVQRDYIRDIAENAAVALQTVDFGLIASEVGFENPWRFFSRYLSDLATMCSDLTLPAWRDRLGGVEDFTGNHCWTMVESLRID